MGGLLDYAGSNPTAIQHGHPSGCDVRPYVVSEQTLIDWSLSRSSSLAGRALIELDRGQGGVRDHVRVHEVAELEDSVG